jgi:hypothetical protein
MLKHWAVFASVLAGVATSANLHLNDVGTYETAQQFVDANEGCCKLTWSLTEGRKVDWSERASDSGDGFFTSNIAFEIKVVLRKPSKLSIRTIR